MTDYTIPLHETNPWEEEPELRVYGDNTSSYSTPVPHNHYWNGMSPELEFCQYVAEIVQDIQRTNPEGINIVETGLGQGFVTRRVIPLLRPPDSYYIYDTDEHFLDLVPMDDLPEVDFTLLLGTPERLRLSMADLVVLDSDMPEPRITELKTWFSHGRPGSHLIIHDAPGQESRPNDLAKIIRLNGIEGTWLDNYRGGWHGIHP